MPKFVEVPVFTVGELSEKARDKAHSEYLSDGFDPVFSDNRSTIESFCELFSVRLNDWAVDSCSYSYDATIPQQRNITKKQALAMVNSWETSQGYFLASVACDAIKESWYCGSIKYAIRNALDSMFQAYQNDLEYLHSVGCFIESCEANEYTFLESGELFNV